MQRAIQKHRMKCCLCSMEQRDRTQLCRRRYSTKRFRHTGVAVTKLDGTAKGGIVIAVKKEIGAPVRLIGIGEKLDDLRDFVGRDFVEALFERGEKR